MPVEVAVVERKDVQEYILANAGDTLVVIDDREAGLNLKKAEIAYREARNALERSKQMKSRNLISEEEYETTLLAYERAKTELGHRTDRRTDRRAVCRAR